MRHLYIHFPYCASRCGYCDFYSQAGGVGTATTYVDAVAAELEAQVGSGGVAAGLGFSCGDVEGREVVCGGLETVYLGGGTPTLLGSGLLARALAAAAPYLRPDAEVTVEANPSTVDLRLAEGLMAAGVNRVSLGVQSFDERLRRNLERAGRVDAVAGAVAALRAAGLANLGIDLMFSIPGQMDTELARDLEQALELEPEHISYYELTVKEGSGYQKRWSAELERAGGRGGAFYETVVDTLTGAGYGWYETSNFALPGKECRHNLAYWRGDDFLGLGAGAWSSIGAARWRNAGDISAYMEAAASGSWNGLRQTEELSESDRLRERLLLGLRTGRGVERAAVAGAIDAEQENILLRNGFLVNEGDRICLTREGRFVANEVCARLLRD